MGVQSPTAVHPPALALRALGAVVYLVVVGLLAALLTERLKPAASAGAEGAHVAAVRALVVHPDDASRTLARVGGHERAKAELRTLVLTPLRHPAVFWDPAAPSLRPPRGVLLCGPPGTGKTMLARACANEARVPFLSLHAAALESKWWGEAPKLLDAAFRLARTELAPCIVFFDEIDGLGRARTETDQSCVYSFKCELLRNLDGGGAAEGEAAVVVLACTNCPQSLDPALRRRFARTIEVGRPDAAERRAIVALLSGAEAADAALLDRVARASEGLTGADLAARHQVASSARLGRPDVAEALASGRATTGAELLRDLGPLTWEDWAATGLVDPPTKPHVAVVHEVPPGK